MSVPNPCRGFVFALVITANLETASARIGWTLEECVRQYGQFSTTEPEDGSYSFRVGNISIVARFLHGLVGEMTYRKADKSEFTEEEIKVLLDKNGGGRKWKLGIENQRDQDGNVSSAWVTNDRSLYGVYTEKSATFPKPFLVIITAEQHKADKQTSREEAERNLNGL